MQIRSHLKIQKKSNKRTYYAATLGTTVEPIKAQICNTKLETFEAHSHLAPYSEVRYLQGYQSVKRFINPEVQPSFAWNTRFSISHDGLINSPNYCEGSFSSEFKLRPQKYSFPDDGNDHSTHQIVVTYPGRFVPDLLYAIPQAAWDDFVVQLPLQNIVKILNLSVHRHLWPAYNYSATAKDSTLRECRADAFSKYHFLVSFLDPVNE